MLTTLQEAKKRGAKMIAINPLPEAGLLGFMNPQQPLGMLGKATPLADLFLPVRINGDLALLKGILKELIAEEEMKPGTVFDHDFIEAKTQGLQPMLDHTRAIPWDTITTDSALDRAQIRQAAELVMSHRRIIICWAMGLTQQNNAVETIQEIVNLLLLRGSIGKQGAGVCPVRGHSNVQGDRTMGIWEKLKPPFRKALRDNFNFEPPERDGFDAVETIHAMHQGKVKVFFQLGGNFLSAGPDTLYLQQAMSKLKLSVRVGTKLNRSDLVAGQMGMILPCLGRSEIDRQSSGGQFVTTENSMGVVETSRGRFEPASPMLRSEVAILCNLAEKLLNHSSTIPWRDWCGNYDLIRDNIAKVIPGCSDYNNKVRLPGGFYLPNAPRNNEYPTEAGRALFTVNPIPQRSVSTAELILMTLRSHDQFNTTIYGLHDRYRGIHNERRVIFMNKQDMADRTIQQRGMVDITSNYQNQKRQAPGFIAIEYNIPQGCCAVYYPEGNVLVPLSSVANESNQPASKYVIVTVAPTNQTQPQSHAPQLPA
jgi:molybdopterin-dependent oxidoreductase alpha subunit